MNLQKRDEAAPQFSLIDLWEQEHTKAGDGESGFSELGGTCCSGCMAEIAALSGLRKNHSLSVRRLSIAIRDGPRHSGDVRPGIRFLPFAGRNVDDSFAGTQRRPGTNEWGHSSRRENWRCRHGERAPESSRGNHLTVGGASVPLLTIESGG